MAPGAHAAVLAAQQRALAALITAAAPPADDAADVSAVLRPLAGAAPRLAIYRAAYRARLVEALRSNHPVLHRVLGDDDFRTLALAYLAARPSRHPSIRWFGHRLAAWLDERLAADPQALPHPALADLARMEWAIGSAFDSADAVPLRFEDLAAVPAADWPALRFAAHPGLHRVALDWAVEPLWRALSADEHAATEPPAPHAHTLLVWRTGLETHWRSAEPGEDAALAACVEGLPFAALCERVAADAPAGTPADSAAARVAAWLRGWVDAGMLCGARAG